MLVPCLSHCLVLTFTMKQNATSKSHPPRSTRGYNIARILGWELFAVIALTLLGASAMGVGYGLFDNKYQHRFYPGVAIGDLHLSGMTYLEAYDRLEKRAAAFEKNGLLLTYTPAAKEVAAASVALLPVVPASDPASNDQELYDIDWKAALEQAYALGRDGSFEHNLRDQIKSYLSPQTLTPRVTVNEQLLRQILTDTFDTFEELARDATLTLDSKGEVAFVRERTGTRFDDDIIVKNVTSQLQLLNHATLAIELEEDTPRVTEAMLQEKAEVIDALLDRAPLTLTYENTDEKFSWDVHRAQLASIMTFTEGTFTISAEAMEKTLPNIAHDFNRDANEGRFEVVKDSEGKLIEVRAFQEPQQGRAMDAEKTAAALTQFLTDADAAKMTNEQKSIPISVATTDPKFTPENIHTLGIQDILGTGHSNMGGSPANRRSNIARGVDLLNGLLIAPDEEFSLLSALKPFTEDNGYKSELVIKGNKTTPEIGGGLCQIGTTTFRAAMGSGLDITKRQNHSYAVSYYADDRNHQPGTDATIYDPAPDFAFINDTPGYILLQTRIDGNDLYFDFWGTRDGRTSSFSPPVTSNWVAPPPLKEVPTTELAPGERKCTEIAHAGVSAIFTYSVDYSDSKHHEEEFRSVYKPWQAVCLVGVAKEEQKTIQQEAPQQEESVKKEKN